MKWGLTPTENGLVWLNLCGRQVCLKFESYTFLAYLHNRPQSIYTYMYNIDINPKSKPIPGHGKKQITAIKQKYSRFKCKPLNHWNRKAYIPRTFLKVCLRRNRIKAKNWFFLGVAFARICCNYVRFVFKPFFGRNLLWWCEFHQCYK